VSVSFAKTHFHVCGQFVMSIISIVLLSFQSGANPISMKWMKEGLG